MADYYVTRRGLVVPSYCWGFDSPPPFGSGPDYWSSSDDSNDIYARRAEGTDLALLAAERALEKELLGGNVAMMAFGRLAQKRAQRSEVRDFGALLVRNHVALNRIATRGRPAAEFELKPERLQAYERLAKISRPRFDAAFLKFVIADHKPEIYRLATLDLVLWRPLVDETVLVLQRQLAIAAFLQKPQAGQDRGLLH
jgi:hypothetical protein